MSHKAELIRNFRKWCIKNNYLPLIRYVLLDEENPFLKEEHCNEESGTILINISPQAVKYFRIEGDTIKTKVSMKMTGNTYPLSIDIDSIIYISASEINAFLTLEPEFLYAYLGVHDDKYKFAA